MKVKAINGKLNRMLGQQYVKQKRAIGHDKTTNGEKDLSKTMALLQILALLPGIDGLTNATKK